MLGAELFGDGDVDIKLRAFDVGTADGELSMKYTVEVQKEKPVYIGQGELCESITLDKTEAEV